MVEKHKSNETSAADTELQSLTELFHLVESLIPENQRLVTVSPDTPVAEAVQLLHRYNFSQLPVVAGKAVLGIFSFRSLSTHLLQMGHMKEDFGNLPVDEFMEQLKFVQPTDNWESLLPYLNTDDGVLVGHRDRLDGILTAMDVLNYLHKLASPFVVLAEIELSLRRIIRACVNAAELRNCIQNSLGQKYSAEEIPTELSEMTLNDYVQIIGDGRNWSQFEVVFGQGEWQRKSTRQRLDEVRKLRNEIFHFKRPVTPDDYDKLAIHRNWLQIKARTFEARQPKKVVPIVNSTKNKWDEPSFFAALKTKCGQKEVEVAGKILAWARQKSIYVWWGEGKRSGSFVPIVTHEDQDHQLFAVWTYGKIEIYFYWYQYKSPFNSEKKRLELLQRLNNLPGVSMPREAIAKRPSFSLALLQEEAVLQQFLEILDWVVSEIQTS